MKSKVCPNSFQVASPMLSWNVTSPSDGAYMVEDKPFGTVVWFYDKSGRWECQDCIGTNCQHIAAAKNFEEKRSGAYAANNRTPKGAVIRSEVATR